MNQIKYKTFTIVSMKNFIPAILIFGFFLTANNVKSQDTIPFPMDESAKWNVKEMKIWQYPTPYPTWDWIITNSVYYFDGDTVFDGIQYKALYADGSRYYASHPNDVYYYYHQIINFFRQEASRIYQKDDYYSELLLYDFSLSIGDTLQRTPYSLIIVEDTASIIINGITLKTIFTYEPNAQEHKHNKFTEGIGSIYGLIEKDAWRNSYLCTSELICYAENGFSLYNPWNYSNCNLIVESKEYEPVGSSKIFPNPLTEMATLHSNFRQGTSCLLTVINSVGQLVYTTHFTGNEAVIFNRNSFNAGLHFYSIINEANHQIIGKGKFIVQ